MVNCPIINKDLELKDCEMTKNSVLTDSKEENVPGRVKRVNGWKFICKSCKNYKK